MQASQDAVNVGECGVDALDRLIACLQDAVRREMPLKQPFAVHFLLRRGRIAPLTELSQNASRAVPHLLLTPENLIGILWRHDFLFCQCCRQLFCRLHGYVLAVELHKVLHHCDNDVSRNVHVLHPLIALADFLAVQSAVIVEHAVERLGKRLVFRVCRHLRAEQTDLICVQISILRRIIRHALHKSLAFPVAIGGTNLLLRQAQETRELLDAAVRLLMVAHHQPIYIHAHRIARRIRQIIQYELIRQRRHIKQRIRLIKGKHCHHPNPPSIPILLIISCLPDCVKCDTIT